MTEAQTSRFCGSCAKTVVDFTRMSNEQILNYLSVGSNICGRFEVWQINSINAQLADKPKNWFKLKGVIIGVFLLFVITSSFGQTKPKTKKVYHKQVAIRYQRQKMDSLITYYPGVKLPDLPEISLPVKLDFRTRSIAETSYLIGGLIIGVNITNDNKPPVGYFRTIEDMMQVVQ